MIHPWVSFYVLGGTGCRTPPLIGARTLRRKHALMSYGEGLFVYSHGDDGAGKAQTVTLRPMHSGHMAIDLAEQPAELGANLPNDRSTGQASMMVELVGERKGEESILAFWTEPWGHHHYAPDEHMNMTMDYDNTLAHRLQGLAQQLSALRDRQRELGQ